MIIPACAGRQIVFVPKAHSDFLHGEEQGRARRNYCQLSCITCSDSLRNRGSASTAAVVTPSSTEMLVQLRIPPRERRYVVSVLAILMLRQSAALRTPASNALARQEACLKDRSCQEPVARSCLPQKTWTRECSESADLLRIGIE